MKKGEHSKINSLQALRGLAFLGVFASHTGIKYFEGGGKWGVSVFFILSGFLMTYNYYGKKRIMQTSFAGNLLFAWNKIKYLYPLHIVTMLASVIFLFVGEAVDSIAQAIVKIFLNLLLLQQWIPIENSSINVTSWYLSVAVFLYFLFPYILKFMERDYSVNKAKRVTVFLFFIQIVVSYSASFIPALNFVDNNWMERDLILWFIYQFPPVRAIDFAIGCNVGYCFIVCESAKTSKEKYTIFEAVTIIFVVAANICYLILYPREVQVEMSWKAHPERWWTYTVIFTFSSCLLVWVFANNQGSISKCLINRITLYLGNISQFCFLIHTTVISYVNAACILMFSSEFYFLYGGWVNFFMGFILTLAATQIWMLFIHKKIKY